MWRDSWPQLGIVTYYSDVYRICRYSLHPVVVFLADANDPIGYVPVTEFQLAREGHIPNVVGPIIPRLHRDHIELRKVVGQLIRHSDPTGVYDVTPRSRQGFPRTSAVLRDAGFLREVRHG